MQVKPLSERTPDFQYGNQLVRIFNEGERTKHPHQDVGRRVLLTLPVMEFDLANGFPIITERYMPFSKTLSPIGEMLAFINGAHTGEEMKKWGCKWWDTWTTPEKCKIFNLPPGEMGRGSYGPGFNPEIPVWQPVVDHPDGGRWTFETFRMFEHLVREIKERPFLSTHKISCWLPQYCLQHSGLQRQVVVAPCHGDIQVTILGEYLDLTMTQRSGDFPVGVPADIAMYAALAPQLAQVTGFKARRLLYRVVDAHIYENQLEEVQKMFDRKPFRFGTLHMTQDGKSVTDIFDFRREHFFFDDYESHEALPIPVTE